MSTEMITLYGAILSLLMGVTGYFLKRTMGKVDTHGDKIQHIEKTYVEETALDVKISAVECRIAEVKDENKKSSDNMTKDIASIRDKYLTKEDFYRSQADTNKKLDRIYDLILEMKGANGNG